MDFAKHSYTFCNSEMPRSVSAPAVLVLPSRARQQEDHAQPEQKYATDPNK